MEYYSIVGNSSDNSDSENSGGASEPVFSKPQSPNQGLGGGSHHSTPQHTPQTPIAQEIKFATPLNGEWANSEGVPIRFRTVENLLRTCWTLLKHYISRKVLERRYVSRDGFHPGKQDITTGNSNATEGHLFCRGPDFGHSAKDIFAEGQSSAKSDLRQRLLRRGPGPRQRKALGQGPSLPSARS